MLKLILPLLLLLSITQVPVFADGKKQIPITITAEPDSEMKSGKPLLLRITIANGLSQDIRFSTFSFRPNEWNGESANISLPDIYRDENPMSRFLARPTLGEVPKFISSMGSYPIKPGESRSILVDISKWQIVDGWVPGRYKIIVRADHIEVDDYTKASVMSDFIEFTIK